MRAHIQFCLSCLVLTLISCSNSEPTRCEQKDWKVLDMDQITLSEDDHVDSQLIIADLHQDGIQRLYCLVNNLPTYSILYEFSYKANNWTKTRIDRDGLNLCTIALGNCRNDGILRLYGVSTNTVCEFNFSNGQWSVLEIFTIREGSSNAYSHRNLAIGDVRNEGFESLYFFKTWESNNLFEISFRKMNWETVVIDSVNGIEDITIGDGRREGNDNLYITNSNTYVFEYRYRNDSWENSELGQLISLPSTAAAFCIIRVLPSHNGEQAVYASTSRTGGELFEFFFENNQWTKTKIGDEPGIMQICGGMGRNDGVNRLYCSECFDILSEFTYNGGSWTKSCQLETNENTSLHGLIVGPGRGDGINRIYVQQFIGHLFEFTFNK
jgi:frataxin-like iron-binding protein CyaY